ncbi:MAG: DNA-directed RNA polymerase subunit alpha [Defluviitaleaceae bacterium]|nr:DNA-directed RNA polymerase subunit alpha [Defluviitaleaceae bacterium]
MLEIDKPEITTEALDEQNHSSRFVLEPLKRGYGTTLGNSLRRVLLSSLPGTAVTSVLIEGVLHEFTSLEGVVEDVTQIVLNLKKLVLKMDASLEVKELYLESTIPGKVFASDIQADADVEIINPNLHIATVATGGSLKMTLKVRSGHGYVGAADNKRYLESVGEIAIDSIYTPILNASYEVEKTRVGQDASYDKLTMDLKTDGSLKPTEAISLASKLLVEHFNVLVDLDDVGRLASFINEREDESQGRVLDMPIEELDLSVRAYNCLRRHGVDTVLDLASLKEEDVIKVKNLGKKSMKEIKDKLLDLGLGLGFGSEE